MMAELGWVTAVTIPHVISWRLAKEQKGQRICIRCPLAWYPPPGTPTQVCLVVHRGQSQASRVASRGGRNARRSVAHNAIISRAERLSARRVRDGHRGGVERG